MLFNSFEFVVFLCIVYVLYWFVFNKNLSVQNILLLVSSYFFYGCWDWRFLFLLILSTLIDYTFGLLIFKAQKRKRLLLWLSIFNNLLILGFFKYYNFFAVNVQQALGLAGFHVSPWLLNIVLPIGISFYTFHGLSYVIDIYNDKIQPTRNFIEYAVFVCFFPLLVAGPIERGSHLLPQVKARRPFSYQQSLEGLRLILWGYFLKVVIADSLSLLVNDIFKNYKIYHGQTLFLGIIYFSIQIYGDFCGYTNIAIGVAKLFGFELLSNFNHPFSSKSVTEFWRRWHISLSSWFYDYLFNPIVLALRNWGKASILLGLMITFFLSGFWHGAGWKFIVYGLLNGIALVYEYFARKQRKKIFGYLPSPVNNGLSILITYAYMCFCWIFFRAPDLGTAVDYIHRMGQGLSYPTNNRIGLIYVIIPLLVDWQQRRSGRSERNVLAFKNNFLRWGMYFVLGICVLVYSVANPASFIYFQF